MTQYIPNLCYTPEKSVRLTTEGASKMTTLFDQVKQIVKNHDEGIIRKYDVYAVRGGFKYKMNKIPMTHNDACELKSRFTQRPETIYQIEEKK